MTLASLDFNANHRLTIPGRGTIYLGRGGVGSGVSM